MFLQLHLTADVIQKLHLIALELPVGGRFDIARQRIAGWSSFLLIENSVVLILKLLKIIVFKMLQIM